MMKTLTLTLLSNLVMVAMLAQPTISDDWVPQVDDIWNASLTFETPDLGEAGANVTWDFSDVNVENFYFEIIFNWVDPAETPYVDSFPDATICADLEAPGIGGGFAYGYYRSGDSGFEYLGSGSEFGFDIFSDPQTFDFIGMDFEATVVDSYELVRYNNFTDPRMSKGATSYTYDAYGTLILPDVTVSDAIRIFQIDVETDSIVQASLATVRVDSLISYAWIADGSVFPVALWQISTSYSRTYLFGELIGEEVEGPDTSFSINPDYSLTSALANHFELPDLDVFPTIAKGELNVRVDMNSTLQYSIYTLSGNQVDQGYLDGDVTTINVGHHHPGYYAIKVDGYAPRLFVRME